MMKTANSNPTFRELASAEVLAFSDGYRTKQAQLDRSGFRIIRVADIQQGTVSLDGQDFVSHRMRGQIGEKLGRPGDILLTTKGTVGRVAVLPELNEDVVYSPQLCFFRVLDANVLDRGYLRYWFNSRAFLTQAANRMNNTDMAAYINLADIGSLRIDLPDIDTQRAIAQVLGALDDKIAANKNTATTADALSRATFQEAISWRGKNVPLDAIAVARPGKHLARVEYEQSGPYPVYGSNSLMGYAGRYLYDGPMVVIARIGSSCGALRWSPGPAWINNNASALLPRPGVAPAILWHAMNRMPMAPYRAGSGQPFIRIAEMMTSTVTIPDEVDARRVETLHELTSVRSVVEDESRTLAATRDALLPALMSGKLRVRDAERVVAEAV